MFYFAVHECLRQLSRSLTTERERLKCALEQEAGLFSQNNALVVASLKQALAEVSEMSKGQSVKTYVHLEICERFSQINWYDRF